jgi:membrane associated rhomboid family serine protease
MNYYNQQPPFTFTKINWKQFLKGYFALTSMVNKLILINVGVYLIYLIFKLVVGLSGFLFQQPEWSAFVPKVVQWLSCPASIDTLLLQPWSLITSIFLHVGFWHILFNMIMLSVVGGLFRTFLNEKKLLITYIFGGIFGNLLYIASYNYFPVFSNSLEMGSFAMGASGAIMAIMAAITAYKPNYKINLLFIGPVKLLWVTLVFVFIDLLSIEGSNAGGHLAHLGGVVYGAISILIYTKVNFNFLKIKKKDKKKPKFATSTNYSYNERPVSDEEYNARKVENDKKIDTILDKISKNGYESLSKEEKEFLFKQKR